MCRWGKSLKISLLARAKESHISECFDKVLSLFQPLNVFFISMKKFVYSLYSLNSLVLQYYKPAALCHTHPENRICTHCRDAQSPVRIQCSEANTHQVLNTGTIYLGFSQKTIEKWILGNMHEVVHSMQEDALNLDSTRLEEFTQIFAVCSWQGYNFITHSYWS